MTSVVKERILLFSRAATDERPPAQPDTVTAKGDHLGTTFEASTKSANAPKGVKKGEYDAKFKGVESGEIENSQFGDGKVFFWKFALLDDDGKAIYSEGEPIEVSKTTSRSTNVKSKTTPGAVKVLKALLSDEEFEDFKDGKSKVKDEELIDRVVVVEVFIKDNDWPGIEEIRRKRSRR